MKYKVRLKPKAVKDIEGLLGQHRERVMAGLARLEHNLDGDVKHLTHHTPEYRLRVGNFRVLFEIEGSAIVIYRVRHRRDAYQR